MNKITATLIAFAALINTGFALTDEEARYLLTAVSRGQTETVLAWAYSADTVNVADIHGNTPLHLAAENGNVLLVNILLEKGAEINAVNIYGYTPVYLAMINGHREASTVLAGKGADLRLSHGNASSAINYIVSQGFSTLEAYNRSLSSGERGYGPNALLYIKPWEKHMRRMLEQENEEQAIESATLASYQHDPYAHYVLGKYYCEKGQAARCVSHLTAAAHTGEMEAQYLLGLYYNDAWPVPNPQAAYMYSKMAADAGHRRAMGETAKHLLFGIGTPQDYALASVYIQEAIQRDAPEGFYYQGIRYYNGLGVPVDETYGRELMALAATKGSLDAVKQLKKVLTQDVLDYLATLPSKNRAEVRTYMLSQGAFIENESEECDTYNTDEIFEEDYGIKKASLCFNSSEGNRIYLDIRPDITYEYKEWLINYAALAPVSYTTDGE